MKILKYNNLIFVLFLDFLNIFKLNKHIDLDFVHHELNNHDQLNFQSVF
jgi:hypothetical protein